MITTRLKYSFSILLLAFVIQACKVNYSFTGAPIPENIKTFTVKPFTINAANAPAPYGQQFAEALKDRILTRTKLTLQNSQSDVLFEGRITAYSVNPIAIQNNEQAAQNRLSVSVQVSFLNTKDPKNSFEQSFTRFTDYDAAQNLSTVETQLLEEINEQLTIDIFNKAFNNW